MQVFSTISDLTSDYLNIAVALGTFDGVHLGHQSIIRRAVRLAESIGGTSVVFSFNNHPLSTVHPERCPLRIADNAAKERLLDELGVSVLMNIPFTKELAALSPREFLTLLKANFAPRYVVVGPNYSFGHGGRGNPDFLLRDGASFGFIPEIQPPIYIDGKIVSSTRIRRLLACGDVAAARRLLGRRFQLESRVIHGDQRGRTLGFPTANLDIEAGRVTPDNGVYAVYAVVDGARYRAVANIGTNPTFHGEKRHLEAHIFDFSADIYGKILSLEFVDKIRGEQPFRGPDALVAQIHADVRAARHIFSLQDDDFMIK